jgi:intein-encoded DNA endonuclease-like protein
MKSIKELLDTLKEKGISLDVISNDVVKINKRTIMRWYNGSVDVPFDCLIKIKAFIENVEITI